MKEVGKVLKIEGSRAIIEVPRSSTCAECRACIIGEKGEIMLAKARNQAQAKAGDKVGVEVEPKTALLAAVIVYIIPLFFLILGYFLGTFLSRGLGLEKRLQEGLGVLSGFSLLILSYFIIRAIDKWLELSHRFEPVVTQIIQKESV